MIKIEIRRFGKKKCKVKLQLYYQGNCSLLANYWEFEE